MSDDTSIELGQAPDFPPLADCDCCEGIHQETPGDHFNRPGLPAISYRVGTFADFKASMLARLSSADNPALAGLGTRDDADLSIALIDAWACICDVLTFYQERIANESYLITAGERLSILELARLIGYRLRPGAAADTYLAFFLDQIGLEPGSGNQPIRISAGTRAQSVPGQDEEAQTFETVEEIEARVEWNALRLKHSYVDIPGFPDVLKRPDTVTYVKGAATQLSKGDVVLFVGPDREAGQNPNQWAMRRLTGVEPDFDRAITRLEWQEPLNQLTNDPAKPPRIYGLKQHAALFGYNAPHPGQLARNTRTNYGGQFDNTACVPGDWYFLAAGQVVYLDTVYKDITPGSWVVLESPSDFSKSLYKVHLVNQIAKTAYTISGKISSLTLDAVPSSSNWESDVYRTMAVYGGSTEYELAEAPFPSAFPCTAATLQFGVLEKIPANLPKGRRIIVRGRAIQARLVPEHTDPQLILLLKDPPQIGALEKGTVVTVIGMYPIGLNDFIWVFRMAEGTIAVTRGSYEPDPFLELFPASEEAGLIAEAAEMEAMQDDNILRLRQGLTNVYDWNSVEILANVAHATHGETVSEILGSGDARIPFQRFDLKQKPLTYVRADVPEGAVSTLELRVNDLLYEEAPFFYGLGPKTRNHVTQTADDGTTSVILGDGRTGARLPSGRENIVATYRKGIGTAGNVRPGTIKTLLDHTLGLREVTNPVPARGGDDPESRDAARRNAPITVLTMGRAVSLQDYEDFSLNYAGVAKALATRTWDGTARRVIVTVAGPGGSLITPGHPVWEGLLTSLRSYGDPFVDIELRSYRHIKFNLGVSVGIDGAYIKDKILVQVEGRLRETFSFDHRKFGQMVALSEVMATIHEIDGVVSVHVDPFYRGAPPSPGTAPPARLIAEGPVPGTSSADKGAELLILDPAPLVRLEASS